MNIINNDDINNSEQRMPTVLGGSILYLIVTIIMIVFPRIFVSEGLVESASPRFFSYIFMSQIIVIGLPPVLYLLFFKLNIQKTIRLNKITVAEGFLVFGMAVFGYGVVILINLIWNYFISHIGPPVRQAIPPILTGTQYLLALIGIAIFPAVLEELLFRGVILRGYERFGKNLSIVLSGTLFAFMHFSFSSLPAILLMGILISYIVHRSNSIWNGVIYHFTNNAIAVTFLFIAGLLQDFLDITDGFGADITDIPSEFLIMGILVWSVIGLIAAGLFVACFYGFMRITEGRLDIRQKTMKEQTRHPIIDLIPAIAGVIIAVVFIVYEVIYMINV